MNEHQESAGYTGEFFSLSMACLNDLVRDGAGAEEVMAYIVLARGVNRRGDERISTHGANSVATRTGMSHRRATHALEWLVAQNAIRSIEEETTPRQLGKGSSRKHRARWVLPDAGGGQDLFLANALTDGIGRGISNPPLRRIYEQVSLGDNLQMSAARLDALVVLLHLYRHQDFVHCGGIDPRAGIYRCWTAAENVEGKQAVNIEGTNAALYEIQGEGNMVFVRFAAEALFYVAEDDGRTQRFWEAFHNLRRLGFVYEVTQIWSGDPNGTNGHREEPIYTLYVHDRHAREHDPFLQREVHSAAFRTGALDTYTEFSRVDGDLTEESNLLSGRFRYIAAKKNRGFPLGIYRLRFRPRTSDSGKGIEAERTRVQRWAAILRKLSPATTDTY